MTVNKSLYDSGLTPTDYEKLGRDMEHIVASSYKNKSRLVMFSLIRGLATGAGSVIGASVVLVLLLWVLSGLENIPLIGDIFENARQSIEQTPLR